MSVCQAIPEGLAEIPPGPRLAAALDGLDLSRLSGFDCVEVLKARYRQLSHDRAQLMATMVETGLRRPGPDDLARAPVPDEFSPDEIRAALVLTRRSAEDQFWLAHDLITRLPGVYAALGTGHLDEPRARVLSEWTTDLSPDQARAVCHTLLPRALTLTTGQISERVKKLAIAIDPDWARRRYEAAIAERKVVGYRNPDGSANLSRQNLPVDRVAAACGHIDALAGHPARRRRVPRRAGRLGTRARRAGARFCVMVGCRAPAEGTDTDHTLDHARGGATVEHNLGPGCRHDHRLKHEGGWQLHQPEPGLFRWTNLNWNASGGWSAGTRAPWNTSTPCSAVEPVATTTSPPGSPKPSMPSSAATRATDGWPPPGTSTPRWPSP